MKKLLLGAALLLLPLPALAQIQFNSVQDTPKGPTLPPSLTWLTRQPVTLFDLGLMELTRQAAEQLRAISGVGGAVAEYREDLGLILITFYPATNYRPETCTQFINQMRTMLFPQYKDRAMLTGQLASLFSNYGPQAAGRPESIGEDLLKITHMVVRLTGGGCEMTLDAAAPTQHVEPGYTPPPLAQGEQQGNLTPGAIPQIPPGLLEQLQEDAKSIENPPAALAPPKAKKKAP